MPKLSFLFLLVFLVPGCTASTDFKAEAGLAINRYNMVFESYVGQKGPAVQNGLHGPQSILDDLKTMDALVDNYQGVLTFLEIGGIIKKEDDDTIKEILAYVKNARAKCDKLGASTLASDIKTASDNQIAVANALDAGYRPGNLSGIKFTQETHAKAGEQLRKMVLAYRKATKSGEEILSFLVGLEPGTNSRLSDAADILDRYKINK